MQTKLSYQIEGKKIFLLWEGERIKVIDKILIYKELPSLMKRDSYEEFLTCFKALEKKIAVLLSGRLLAARSYLSSSLKDKLLKRGLSEEAAAYAITWALSHGFIDDTSQVKRWILGRLKKGYGLKCIAYEMQRKKIPLEMLDQAKEMFLEEERKACLALKEKWLRLYGKDRKGVLKVQQKIYQRGFSQIP